MFEWRPGYWRGWREAKNLYRHLKSERDRQLAVSLLELRDGDRVLEVGCGYGWVTQALLKAAKIQWMGVDRSEEMIQEFHGTTLPCHRIVLRADAHCLPFRSSVFDRVLCSGVLMHLTDECAALKEMARVLKPNGLLVVSMNNVLSPFSLPVWLLNARKKDFIQKFHFPGTYAKWLRDIGLHIKRLEGDGLLATVAYSWGPFSFPPQFVFPAVKRFDQWAVQRSPKLAYEVWFAATKPRG